MSAAISLLGAAGADGGARVVVFCGGPSVGGQGAIADASLRKTIRSHGDIDSKAEAGSRRRAVHFYDGLAQRAVARGTAIDLVCASLEDVGLFEMRPCVQRTGGAALVSETFGASELLASLEVLLKGGSETGQTEQGFDAKCELRLTKQCTAMTLLGAGEIGGGTTVGAAGGV